MTTATDERAALAELAEQLGWQRSEYERADVYVRGMHRVHAVWRDPGVLNGGSHYEDSVLMSYTRESAKVRGWLTR